MLKSLLDSLLKVLYSKIGQATPTGSVIYALPTIPTGSTEATTTINAPGDGYFLLRSWSIVKGNIYNQSIKYPSEARELGSGLDLWNATQLMSVYFTVPCSKGDTICAEIRTMEKVEPKGNIVFFPRVSSS